MRFVRTRLTRLLDCLPLMLRRTPHWRPTALVLLGAVALLALVPSVSSQAQPQVGYGVLTAAPGSRLPVASALFSFRTARAGVVAEAGVGAVAPIRSGRIFVDETSTSTGLALVNSSAASITLDFSLRDPAGQESATTSLTLGPGEHVARLVRGAGQLFPSLSRSFSGSLTFQTRNAQQRVAALTIRQSVNAFGEPLLATLPVADLEAAAAAAETPSGAAARIIFPHLGAGRAPGQTLSSQVILINPSSSRLTGQIRLTASDGSPLPVQVNNATVASIPFDLAPDGTFQRQLTSSAVVQGYAVVEVDSGNGLPVGTAIFQFRDGAGRLVSEAGVGAILPTTAARIFVDTVGTQTGVAVASPDGPADLSLELLDRNGLSFASSQMSLAAGGHFSAFVNTLFPGLPPGFTGLMEIRSATPIVPITLKLTTNGARELILTTLPIADLTRPPAESTLILPQLGFGGGFFTRLILISTDLSASSRFTLRFTGTGASAAPLPIALLGQTASSFDLEVAGGGGRQLRPGNTATASQIVTDPGGALGVEIAVNRGNNVVVRPVVIDSDGEFRDDFPFNYSSLDTAVATVDALGRITGNQTGFSTLTIEAGGRVTTSVVAVASVNRGAPAFQATGVTGDLAGRLYLAETERHRLLRSESLGAMPQAYAGVMGTPGLRNDLRLQAQFNRPSQLVFNQDDGTLFVADVANHVIRRVFPGSTGMVETYAGTSQPGSRDGDRSQATFNGPQGLTLDGRGFLWVTDTGNHTIRRMNLSTGQVTTVAGRAGSPGNADGSGSAARFNAPLGIALQAESLEEQLQRELRGDPPPPVRVIVADSGNGRIRRVQEDGQVESLAAGAGSVKARWKKLSGGKTGAPQTFSSPASVAVDPIGNIYVSETGANRVRLVLQSGEVVTAGEPQTFTRPRGLYLAGSGRLLVADEQGAGQELIFAAPQITSLAPGSLNSGSGGNLTIRGRNFSSDALVVVAGFMVENARVEQTNRIVAPLPPSLPSGRQTVTVQTRGGIAQTSLLINPVSLASLSAGRITTIAGGTTFAGDGNAATAARLNLPLTTVVDSRGDVYIADTLNSRIRRVERVSGIITTVAGTGRQEFSGDDGPAVAASLDLPESVAVDRSGNIYVADTNNHRLRRVESATGRITTIAGNGLFGTAEDGQLATEAFLVGPERIAFDQNGSVYFSDSDALADVSSHRVFRIDSMGRLRLVAGNGQEGFSGDGGPATQASLNFPAGIAFDRQGNLYIADSENHVVRRVSPSGQITRVAGQGGQKGFAGDGGAATSARLSSPGDVALDGSGNLYIADLGNNRIRRVDSNGRISTVAGNGSENSSGNGGPATQAGLGAPTAVAVDGAGNIFINEFVASRVRVVNGVTGIISNFAGTGETTSSGDGGPAFAAALGFPSSVVEDAEGNLFIADQLGNRIRRVDKASSVITTVAGNGSFAFSGDGGPATAAALFTPRDVAIDFQGNLLIADTLNNRIRRVDASTNRISTVAGTGEEVADCTVGLFNGDGPASEVTLAEPSNVALDIDGNLLIADTCNNRIRKLDLTAGTITTIAGSGCDVFRDPGCELGDGGPASEASLVQPHDLVVDALGNIFFADHLTNRVRMITRSTGTIQTVAGNGCDLLGVLLALFEGNEGECALQDGVPATMAALVFPDGVTLDGAGNLFVSDFFSVRRVDAASGTITNAAGSRCLFSDCQLGDGGLATEASLLFPAGLEATLDGDLLIADSNNLRIRAVKDIAVPLPRVETLFSDDVEVSGANWSATMAVGPETWRRVSGVAFSGTRSWFAPDLIQVSDQRLSMNSSVSLPADAQAIALSFWHRFDLESSSDGLTGFDAGVVELSTNNGASWFDAGPFMLLTGVVYNSTVSDQFSNPLGGRAAFSGTTNQTFVQTILDLTSLRGGSIRVRFRLGTDSSVGVLGWYVDDIIVQALR